MTQHSRRLFLQSLAASALYGENLPPIRAITKGPKFHWFAYYDKLQFDPSSRYALGMEVDFEHRSPRPEDEITLGIVDTENKDQWQSFGKTRAWNWQQGAMLQWLPGSNTDVIWNDRRDHQFVSIIRNIRTGKERVIPAPIYCLSPDGKTALYPDFRRLNDCRPGYGYAGISDPNSAVLSPENAGIWKLDLESGKSTLIISLADIVKVPNPVPPPKMLGIGDKWEDYWKTAKHWFNHLLVSPDGKRFIFLHRWRGEVEGRSFSTRLFTADMTGQNLHVLDPYGRTSHFVWRDPQTVTAWAWHPSHNNRFYNYTDRTDKVEVIGKDVMTENGHNTFLRNNRWILNDTYPDKQKLQHPYLFEIATERKVPLGHFLSPPEYTGEWRCDNHPRSSPDGKKVCIDSPHNGGRQMYLIDISGIS